MAQEPSDATPLTWSARVYIRPSVVTDLVHSATVSPNVVADAQLTITRRFYDVPDDPYRMDVDGESSHPAASPRSAMRAPSVPRAGPSAHRLQREQSASPPESYRSSPAPSSAPSHTPAGRHSTPSRASVGPSRQTYRSPPPDQVPSAGQHASHASTSSRATSRQSSVSPATASPTTCRRPITRSQSSSSVRAESTPASPRTAESSSPSRSRDLSTPPDDVDDTYQYERCEKTCLPNDEERRANVRHKTIWFKSTGDFVLSSPPPAMAKRPDLDLGNLFFHLTRHHDEPQMWLWCEGADGRRSWNLVQPGYLRTEDKRRLAVTEDDDGLRPSWLGESWFRVKARKMKKSRVKGKSKATTNG